MSSNDIVAELQLSDAWWLAAKKDKKDPNGKELARLLTRVATDRETANMPRRWRNYSFARLMSGRPTAAQFAYGMARRPDTFLGYYGDAEFSAMRSGFAGSMADVYTTRLFSHPTIIQFIPDFGDVDERQAAEDYTTWIEQQFDATDYWRAYDDMGLNALWYGSGWLKHSGTKKALKVESVNPDELLFATEDQPRQTEGIQRVWSTKTAAMGTYGKTPAAREAIKNAQTAFPAFFFGPGSLNTDNVISLLESWICPNPEDPDDKGRHCLVIGGSEFTILDEDWDYPDLPFEHFDFHELPSSTFGQGIAELLFQIQEWMDDTLTVMQESDQRSGTGKWLVEENSNVNVDALGDTNAAAVLYSGEKPEFVTPEPIGEYALARLAKLEDMGMRRVHVNLNSLQSEVPKALSSAIAIERYAQIDDSAMAHQLGRLETLVRRSTRQFLRLGKRFSIPFTMPGRKKQIIDWKKVDPDSVELKAYNVGRLGQTVAGRTQQLEKMVADGDIDRPIFNKYLQIPNLDGRGGMMDTINAPVEGVDKILNRIVLQGKYVPPSPYLNPTYAKQAVESRIVLEQGWGTKETAIDRLRMWRSALLALNKQRQTADAANSTFTGVTPPTSIPGAPIGPDKGTAGAPIPVPQP